MQIAFVAQPFDDMKPPVRGGSLSLWTYYMARLCARRGHEVTVFGANGGSFSPSEVHEDGVNYVLTPTAIDRAVNKAFVVLSAKGRSDAVPSFAAWWHHWGYAREVARRVRRLNCDVAHVMNYSQFVPVLRQAHPRCKISLHMQCEWLTQLNPDLIGPRLKTTDLIVGCSEYITRLTASKFPEFSSRCVTVPNAAEPTIRKDSSHTVGKNILFVGRLSPEKGLHDLIRAFHLVLRQHPDARLHLVGGAGSAPLELLVALSDEPHVADLRQYYGSSNGHRRKDPYLQILEKEAGQELGKRIIFDGRIPHNEIERSFQEAAVLVNPSLSESFGISLVEAMMRGIPVVATRIGGMTYTVDHGLTGLLVEPAKPQALAEALCEILADNERAQKMGEAGRQRALANFTWEKTADLLLSHYTELVIRRQKQCA